MYRGNSKAFTLIEILVVVVILAILAAVVIPMFSNASKDSKKAAFVTSIKTFAQAAMRYNLMTGEYLEDSGSGTLPSGFEEYIQETTWRNGTPIGGVWDSEYNSFGLTSALGVHFWNCTPQPDSFMQEIDELFDDGDLNDGAFRKIADDRFYYVIQN